MGIALAVTLSITYIYGEYIKQKAIVQLSQEDARNTSLLVFQALYSAMSKGWDKSEINEIIARINDVDTQLVVDVHRSDIVAALYGEFHHELPNEHVRMRVQEAMGGKEVFDFINEETIRYYFPVAASQVCVTCHTNARVGDIMGVIDIAYPVRNIKVPLTQIINFFMIFSVSFVIVIFGVLFVEFNKYLAKPMRNLVGILRTISDRRDISERVGYDSNIEEISNIQEFFNSMLDSLEAQFYTDPLTGLANRAKLIEELDKLHHASLVLINVDGFQEINDFYGQEIGDTLLRDIAQRLGDAVLPHWRLYRLQADEFALLIDKPLDEPMLGQIALNLGEAIESHHFIVNHTSELHISATMGLASMGEQLLAKADIARKEAKKAKKLFLYYTADMLVTREYENNLGWTRKIKQAIKEKRVVPYFQPIVNVQSGEVEKYECLVRIIDDEGKVIAPGHFLSIAKKSKLSRTLTRIMIGHSFEHFLKSPYAFSINLTVDDILDPDLNEYLISQLHLYPIGERVIFELLESEGIENFEEVSEFIRKVKGYGCKIAIDDFGTGYSNFEYLMQLQVDFIKIDAAMIKNLDCNPTSRIITQTIVEFATRIGIKTVGEFVYSKRIYEETKALGIDYAQGYYFGEPAAQTL